MFRVKTNSAIHFLCLLAFLLSFGATARAAIVVNGSFEDNSQNFSNYVTLNAGNSSIPGWTVTAGSVDWISNYWQASNGLKSLDMGGLTNGTIVSQALVTVPGQSYLLSFDLAGNPDNAGQPNPKELIVSVGNLAPQTFTFSSTNTTRSNMGWVTKSLTFVADSTSTSLSFLSGNTGSAYGPALDNVSVAEVAPSPPAVPEPSAFAVWTLLGGFGLGAAWLRRRQIA